MKILFATNRREADIPVAVRPIHMIRRLQCDYTECYSVSDVRRHIEGADVVLLSGYKCVPYQDALGFIHKAPVLTGRVHTDLWNRFVARDTAHYDFRIVVCKALLKKYKPEWESISHWSPLCIDIPNYDISRDIDILFWGAISGGYPFRQLIVRTLEKCVVGKVKRVDPFLTIRTVAIGGRKYTYAHVRSVRSIPNKYFGSQLYRLLSRARICCTGPSKTRVPVGKYFEHAACGSVSLSPKFTDSSDLGFVHGETIWFTNKARFMNDLRYLLANPQVTSRIGSNARQLIESRHTLDIRASELFEFLSRKLDEWDEYNG